MKTKQELLKIYSAYLPYELEVYRIEHKHEKTKIFSAYDLCPDGEIENLLPMFYSMDMLTKEIEHKGERFIPINELKHFYGFDYMWSYCTNRQGEFNVMAVAYACVAKLLEWKFNIFNLSDDEYVKLQTITCIS